MPKTKNAFALRDVIDSLKARFDANNAPFVDLSIGHDNLRSLALADWLGCAHYRNIHYHEVNLTDFWFSKQERISVEKRIGQVERHIRRLKNYIVKTFERILSSSNGDYMKGRGARAQKFLADYEMLYTELVEHDHELERNIEEFRARLPAEFKKVFSSRLKQARQQKGLTVNQVAEMLDLSYNGYSQYERGMREPPLWILSNLAKILDVSADWLLGIEK